MAREHAALTVHDLSFSYPRYPGLPAGELFAHLNLTLPPGTLSLLLGSPDSGKTTLCRMILGLVPRFSGGELSGEVCLDGAGLRERPPFDLIEEIGLVFQNPAEQLFATRCDAEVAFALESLGRPGVEIEARVGTALRWMSLEGMRERDPMTLSGGERKKLLLSCLHALDPRIWLLDETLEELDAATRLRLLRYLKERGKTVLVTSAKWHEVFAPYADRLLVLEGGRVEPIRCARGKGPGAERLRRMGLLLPERPGAAVPAPSDTAAEAAAGASRGGPLVVARGLEFSYPGNEAFRLAVSNLEVRGGEVVAVIGANGSGKTTLGRILCGLLRPVGGTVSIALKSGLVPASSEQLNRYTGYLFQDPDLQIFLPTVADELSYGLRLQGLDTEAQRASVADAVERFQLPSPEAPPALLSYGARKRLQAAVCYLLPRPLLVVDEGDSGLGASEFAELLRQLQAPGRGLLFITHDLELAENLSDRVLRMREGTLE